MNAPVKRVQLDLPEKSMARLQDLKTKTEAVSYAEVVKNALRLYENVVAEVDAGGEFLVRRANGELREYVIF
jgi:hypothetical protein